MDDARRETQRAALREAIAALRIQNALTNLATRNDPHLVMRVMREWLDYMDRQLETMARYRDSADG